MMLCETCGAAWPEPCAHAQAEMVRDATRLAAAEAEVERLRATLRWYADRSNYDMCAAGEVVAEQSPEDVPVWWACDGGERARQALALSSDILLGNQFVERLAALREEARRG